MCVMSDWMQDDTDRDVCCLTVAREMEMCVMSDCSKNDRDVCYVWLKPGWNKHMFDWMQGEIDVCYVWLNAGW